jgi:hypothetical protein
MPCHYNASQALGTHFPDDRKFDPGGEWARVIRDQSLMAGTHLPEEPKKAPSITLSQLGILLKTVLPLRVFDVEALLHLAEWIQLNNHRAYLSHRRRKTRIIIETSL